MTQRIFLALLCATVSLSACQITTQIPNTPAVQQQNTQNTILNSALSKRVLNLRQIEGQTVPVARLAIDNAFQIQQESLIAIAEPAIARPDIEPGIAPAYYYGGHDFNQYSIQYAEENRYPGNSASTLVSTYEKTVKPILAEWAEDARLIESRAQINAREPEYIHLPGSDGEPVKLLPDYVFRFASNSRKETLNIYAMKSETRVHRMVWGQPNIDIGAVRVDSDKALNIARNAFASTSNSGDYPIYPDRERSNQKVIYDLPSTLNWQIQLNQHNKDQLRYFLHFNFEQEIDIPMPVPVPEPMPEPFPLEELEAMLDDPNLSVEEKARLKEDYYARQEEYERQLEEQQIAKEMILQPQRHYLSGSIEIDARSGKILSMNRPVVYYPHYYEDGAVSGGSTGSIGIAVPEVMTVDAEPVAADSSTSNK